MSPQTLKTSKNPNHPQKGSTIKVEPIRKKKSIEHIKRILRNKPRDYCLFTLGINTAYRANELLSIRYGQVKYVQPGDVLEVMQTKTKKYRMATLNRTAIDALRLYAKECYDLEDDDFIFQGQRGRLTVPTIINMVKGWCTAVGLKGNYGSHTLRKTWGYWQYKRGIPLPLLMEAFGHATQQQTLAYLCIQPREVKAIFDLEL